MRDCGRKSRYVLSCGLERERGFTLIELLVVIAIISLLASILLPSLKEAQNLARQTVCRSNQHGISVGYHMYASDYKEEFAIYKSIPAYGYRDSVNQWFGIGILYGMTQHVEDASMLFCPEADNAFPFTRPFEGGVWSWLGGYTPRPYYNSASHPFTYGYWGSWATHRSSCTYRALRLGDVGRPADVSLLADLIYHHTKTTHSDGWNVTFLDGHTKWVADERGQVLAEMEKYPPSNSVFYQRTVFRKLEQVSGISSPQL